MIVRGNSELAVLGVNIWGAFTVSNWGTKTVTVETPVQIRGGIIGITEIGAFSYLGQGDSTYNNISKIGRYCSFGPDIKTGMSEHPTTMLTTHPMFAWEFDRSWKVADSLYEDKEFLKMLQHKYSEAIKRNDPTVIGNDVWIGNGAYISKGVKIGDGAVIAARAVVVKDVPPYSIVGGVPARVIRQRFEDKVVEKLLALSWWEYGPEILKNVDISNIERAIFDIEERISKGIKKYVCDKIEFNPEENAIYRVDSDGEKKLLMSM